MNIRWLKNPKLLLAAAVGAGFAVVVFQNTALVQVRFLIWQFLMPRIVLLLLTLVFGFVLGFTTAKFTRFGLKKARTEEPLDGPTPAHLEEKAGEESARRP